ncbi:NodT family efflux transporter outer membrane factor (OMF) lipoprotein [Sphingomonas endophytica]|uniref:NodT family efflux transporter outer membrane factor (OMF) lipoprotein n=1 Tax=Sphingomonas endophytica TaxID=869719 RepID=A0A7X0MNJ5_9SPHN|nr:efflux transporter outer membrane subunit [Sphingomonas endophytica]MBB6505216.1 NodT family efflux transporter outer membrane factor (OMF) lipoprotein [Sphingomonas endophytica]
MRARSATLLTLLLAGCATPHVTPYASPTPVLPSSFTAPQPVAAAETVELRHWWSGFRDPALDRLVSRAIEGNLDLRIASQRLLAARAERDAVAAVRYPVIGVSGGGSLSRSSTQLDYPPGIGRSVTLSAGLDASWEPDLFGRLRQSIDAADAEAAVVEEDRRAILVSLIAEIALDYIDLRSAQERGNIAARDVARLKTTLDATERLHRAGLASGASVAEARAQWRLGQARLPAFAEQIARDRHAIATLTGGFPGDAIAELDTVAPLPASPELPSSVPSQLLRDRPDIRAAERHLAAATAHIHVAAADLLPRFRIPLTLATAASGFTSLVSPGAIVWSLAASGAQTLSDKGQRAARLRAAQALTEAQRLDYERSIRAAMRDVEDVLTARHEEALRHEALTAALVASRAAIARATRERRAGTIGTLDLLTTQRSLYAIEDALAVSRADRLRRTVTLAKSLGGGWQDSYPDVSPAG